MNNKDLERFEIFRAIFCHNLNERSRTAKGKSDTAVSDKKKKLIKDGRELEGQVRENTDLLVNSVWDSACSDNIQPVRLRPLMEKWNSLINRGLQKPEDYFEYRKKLEQEASDLAAKTGKNYRINPAYRVWDVPYGLKIPPVELELAMDDFYLILYSKILFTLKGEVEQAELLAYADVMSDSRIHAWADGCGRISTALVMWLSALDSKFNFPVFSERFEHYAAIQDLGRHVEYYKVCLTRKFC